MRKLRFRHQDTHIPLVQVFTQLYEVMVLTLIISLG